MVRHRDDQEAHVAAPAEQQAGPGGLAALGHHDHRGPVPAGRRPGGELHLPPGVERVGPEALDPDTGAGLRARSRRVAAQRHQHHRGVAGLGQGDRLLGPELARVTPEGEDGVDPGRGVGRGPHEEPGRGGDEQHADHARHQHGPGGQPPEGGGALPGHRSRWPARTSSARSAARRAVPTSRSGSR